MFKSLRLTKITQKLKEKGLIFSFVSGFCSRLNDFSVGEFKKLVARF
jgi:hypothetical protein